MKKLKDAEPAIQYLFWFLILTLITAVSAALVYVAFRMLPGVMVMPKNISAYLSDPFLLRNFILQRPLFLMFFVLVWIMAASVLYLIIHPDLTHSLRWAIWTFFILGGFAIALPQLMDQYNLSLDQTRVINLLEGPDPAENNEMAPNGEDLLHWNLTETPGVQPGPSELDAVTHWLQNNPKAHVIKLKKIYWSYYVNETIVRQLMNFPQFPRDSWIHLASRAANGTGFFNQKKNEDLLQKVAEDPRTPPPILMALLEIPTIDLQSQVFANPNFNPRLREEFLKIGLAVRQSTPAQKLAIARISNLKGYLFPGLSWESDPLIRMAVAQNPSVPNATLEKLCEDPIPQIRQTAQNYLQARLIAEKK